MLKVMIVEDETLVRIGLISAIDWTGNGYGLVGEASDGKEALELCGRLEPDIVITDIRMPRMDGLEFIRELGKLLPDAKVLVLSCHDEFSYAREALKLGVEDYLLKMDISPASLLEALARIAPKCRAAGKKDIPGHARESTVALESLLSGTDPGEEPVTALDPGFIAGKIIVLYALPDHAAQANDGVGRNRLLVDSIAGLFRDCLKRQLNSVSIVMDDLAIVSVLSFNAISSENKIRDELDRVFQKICDSLELSLGVSISVGASAARLGLDGLAISLEEARQACRMRFFNGPGKLFIFGRGSLAPEGEVPSRAPRMDSIIEAVLECDRPRLLGMIDDAARHFYEMGSGDREARLFFYRLVFVYHDQIEVIGGDYRVVLADEIGWIERIMNAENIQELRQHATALTDLVLDFVREHRSEHRSQLVAKAHAWIDANFAEEISLDMLTEHLNINSSYFCKIYRQVTGHTFVERLTKVRMEKAKALLQSTDLMVYDIAAMTGYGNSEYFCRLFKRIIGLTPSQFRNAARENVH